MRLDEVITAVDAHAGGEPGRVIIGGVHDVPGATMLPSYKPGNRAMASIERDDIDGICTALPPGRKTPSDSCDPRHGFSPECAIELNDAACHTALGRPGSEGAGLVGLVGLSWSLLRRRLRRKGRPRAASRGPRPGPGSAW